MQSGSKKEIEEKKLRIQAYCYEGKLCIPFVPFTLRWYFPFSVVPLIFLLFRFVSFSILTACSYSKQCSLPLKEPKWFPFCQSFFFFTSFSLEVGRNNGKRLKIYIFSQAAFFDFSKQQKQQKKELGLCKFVNRLYVNSWIIYFSSVSKISICNCLYISCKLQFLWVSTFSQVFFVSAFNSAKEPARHKKTPILLIPDCVTQRWEMFFWRSRYIARS